jgi:hypothetical protein
MIKVIVTVKRVKGECAVNVRMDKEGEVHESEEYLAKVCEVGVMAALRIEGQRAAAEDGTTVDLISVKKNSETAKALRKKYGI